MKVVRLSVLKEHYEGTKIRTDLCNNNFLQVTEINLGKLHGF